MFHLISSRQTRFFLLAAGAALVGFVVLLVAYISTPRTSDVLPAVTATLVPPTFATRSVGTVPPAISSQEPTFTFGTMGEVSTIEVHASQYGYFHSYEGTGLTNQTLLLQAKGSFYQGLSHFSASYQQFNGNSTRNLETTREIMIPNAPIHTFLQELASFAFQTPPSPDSLPVTQTDCPNYFSYHLQTSKGTAGISGDTCSSVWTVEIYSGRFSIYTKAPEQAFNQIEPYLHRDIFESFVKNETPVP